MLHLHPDHTDYVPTMPHEREESFPTLAVEDHGIAGIVAACSIDRDDDNLEAAVEAVSALWPSCILGFVAIPSMWN